MGENENGANKWQHSAFMQHFFLSAFTPTFILWTPRLSGSTNHAHWDTIDGALEAILGFSISKTLCLQRPRTDDLCITGAGGLAPESSEFG